jgi:hypothetical protein
LALIACPVGIMVLASLSERPKSPAFNGPIPWAAAVVERLGYVQAGVSACLSIAVAALARGGIRWLAWGIIVAVGLFTANLCLHAWMAITGIYL